MKTFVVDSFTDSPFSGNPAGVCIVETPLDETLMLKIAQELGLSETAFVAPMNGEQRYSIRFFSPKMEIPLCGHATLASAKVLFASQKQNSVTFLTIGNLELVAKAVEDQIVLEFPVYETVPAEAPAALLNALKLNGVKNVAYNDEMKILLLEIEDTVELARLAPDFAALYQSHDAIMVCWLPPHPVATVMIFIRDIFGHGVAPMRTRLQGALIPSWQSIGRTGWAKRKCGPFRPRSGPGSCRSR